MATKKESEDLKKALQAQKEIKKLKEDITALAQKGDALSLKEIKALEKQVKAKEKILKNSKEYDKYQKKVLKDTETFGKSWTKLSQGVQKNLGGTVKQGGVYASLSRQIITLEAKQATLSGDELEANMELVSRLREQNDSLLAQAKMTATAEAKARGLNDFAIKRKDLQDELNNLLEGENDERREGIKLQLQALDLEEKNSKKEERLTSIAETQKEIMNSMPDGVQKAVGFGQKLGETLKVAGKQAAIFMILATIIAAAVSEFTELDKAAGEFRQTTGFTNSQMVGIKKDVTAIRSEFAGLGVEAKDVYDTLAALNEEFSDITRFSKETTSALVVLNKNFGVTASDSAKVQSQFEAIGGLSAETAANVQLQVANMANMAGVAPKKVFEDIAQNAEATSTFFKGDIKLLAKQAVEARRLGSNLKESVDLAEKLLDFEGGIEQELVAATFVGGQFNLSQARALAYQGDLVGAQKETLNQLQRSGDFRKKDYFTQQQLAKAAGMTVEQINKQLNNQDKLNSLSYEQKKLAEDAINKGLDITNISKENLALETAKFSKQKEQQTQLENLENSFKSISATVGTVLTPLLEGLVPIMQLILFPVQAMAEGLKVVVNFFKEHIGLAITLASVLGVIYAKEIGGAIASIWKGIVGFLGPLGIPVAIAASIGMVSMAKNAMAQKAGDVMSPAKGKTQISTKEGGLLELSPNDDVVAAPGAVSKLQQASQMSKMNLVTPTGGGQASNGMDALINEMKALRGDMNSGKIKTSTYLDGQKVSSTLGYSVDQNTRNSFNMSAI